LLHDCYDTTVEAAFQIVDELKEKGYLFVTVEELLFD
ncbi:MAG: peptidoglycan N-acetylglucosamine deacetylase, partial [Acetatifactor sp.]|nr:peptidoglycan N-acetylglucosamine deacetylase [Acetatifactor sp.]